MLTRAETLETVYKSVSAEPLVEPEWYDAFYRREVNETRGDDVVSLMALGLRRSHGSLSYKALLMGHSGVGKSTEMTRLQRELEAQFRVRRLSVSKHLDPLTFQPFDVLLLTVTEIVEQTAKSIAEGGANTRPSEALLKTFLDWFADSKDVAKTTQSASVEGSAGLGPSAESWWAKATGLFASMKGEAKYATVRETETTRYRLSRLDTLIKAANGLLRECNRFLRDATGHEWLVVWEDFDKTGVDLAQTESFFISYANVIRDLDAHFIFNIPIALGYSSKAPRLPVPQNHIFCIPDTTVFNEDHTPHPNGRRVVTSVLEARMSPALFAAGQLQRLVVASGGNLRNLFEMTNRAADTAILRGGGVIEEVDASSAIAWLRTSYERQLGETPFDLETVSGEKKEVIDYKKKADRLLQVYNQEPSARVPDAVLYSLLRSRAVQEFNGKRWFGVHPLVVDILAAQGKIAKHADGKIPGGTY